MKWALSLLVVLLLNSGCGDDRIFGTQVRNLDFRFLIPDDQPAFFDPQLFADEGIWFTGGEYLWTMGGPTGRLKVVADGFNRQRGPMVIRLDPMQRWVNVLIQPLGGGATSEYTLRAISAAGSIVDEATKVHTADLGDPAHDGFSLALQVSSEDDGIRELQLEARFIRSSNPTVHAQQFGIFMLKLARQL